MRTLALAFAVTLAALFGFSSSAGASASVDLVWVSTSNTDPAHTPLSVGVGTSAIMAHPGDHVGLAIYLTAGSEGLSAWGISLSFNDQVQVLHTPNEFGVKPTATCTPFPACFFASPTMSPFTPGVSGVSPSGPITTGFVYTFEAGTLGNGLLGSFGPLKIGEVWFEVQSTVGTDGADVASGFFNAGTDGAFDNTSMPVAMIFGNAAVDLWGPEPGTATLLGLGLLGLTLAGRRNRK
jgi:hypothetical protein